MPLRDGPPQAAHDGRETLGWQRCVGSHGDVDHRVESRSLHLRIRWRRQVFVRGVDAYSTLPPSHAEQATVVHRFEEVSGGSRRAAPIVRDGSVREERVYFARMDRAALLYEGQQRLGAASGASSTRAPSRSADA